MGVVGYSTVRLVPSGHPYRPFVGRKAPLLTLRGCCTVMPHAAVLIKDPTRTGFSYQWKRAFAGRWVVWDLAACLSS